MSFEQRISRWRDQINTVSALKGMAVYPSPPDARDYTIDLISAPMLPSKVELPDSPIMLNQHQTPFCGGASGAGIANAYYNNVNQMPKNGFSMTFLYWLSKMYDGIPNLPGTYLRTILKVMSKYGCAPENLQPFSSQNNPQLNTAAYEEALKFKVKSYYRVSTPYEMKVALSNNMYLLLATFITRGNWGRGNKGWISKPQGDFAGGHATRANGYNDLLKNSVHNHTGYFICSNSWGSDWGDKGKFYLPYDYFTFKLEDYGMNKFIEAWAVEFEPKSNDKEKAPVTPKVRPRKDTRQYFDRIFPRKNTSEA